MAGLTEEPIKAIALLILAMFPRQFPGILSGVALGVSIGAGFAVLETFDYAYAFGEAGRPDTFVLLLRGILSPLMHMAWTGRWVVRCGLRVDRIVADGRRFRLGSFGRCLVP